MLSNTIDQEIKEAMLSKDQAKLRGLRAIKSAFLLAKTEKAGAASLNEELEIKILQKLVKQRKESAEIYKRQGRQDLFEIEQEEIDVIEKFLPAQLTYEDVTQTVKSLIADLGTVGMKDMGRVMGLANKALSGRADGKVISEVVKQVLSAN